MKLGHAFVVGASLLLAIAAGVGYAAPLTEQQLLKMKAAGIGENVIVQQIQTDGIAFQADADSTIALRKAGFSDAVLSAVLKAQTGQVTASPKQPDTALTRPTPQQTQVDACGAWQQEYERLNEEDQAIRKACTEVSRLRKPQSNYWEHCMAMSCSVAKRLNNFPAPPNSCDDARMVTVGDPCDDSDYEPNPNTVFKLVQVLQPQDSKLTCAQLKVLTSVYQDSVAQMDQSIHGLTGKGQELNSKAQNASQMAQVASAIGGKGAPVSVAGLEMMSSSDSQAAVNTQEAAASIQQVRDSFQKRHDYLMQIYFQKRCDD